ncbi:Ig-like domain-containing protein [Dysgonomonas sp. 25]|uniref:Ig-like domain-containing protein n=1 Tax=Dysgonomonas sp. 25 TaxID=2302933 RepID=UPI0013D7443B|nr:Ig-like domain-containing protein [Dysgonomonas sp. 25]NDV70172.1 hypothetical protein [Dysgonomonas sp. 25]
MKAIYKFIPLIFILLGGFIVSCSDDDDKQKDVESITILGAVNDTIAIDKNETFQINIETTPKNQEVKFFTTNASVFTIDDAGLIHANEGGVGFLHVVAANGTGWRRAKCVVDVTAYVDSIDVLDNSLVILPIGQTVNFASRFKAFPDAAKNKKLGYKSSNTAVATVDENGVVTAVTKGIAEIRAIPTDGKYDIESEPIVIYSGYAAQPVDRTAWTAVASSTQGSRVVSNLFDGNTNSSWEAAYSTAPPMWILIDTHSLTEFDQVTFIQSNYREAKNIEVYITDITTDGVTQDDPSFTLIGGVFFNDATPSRTLSLFPEAKKQSRYIKVVFLDSRSGNYISLSEIALYSVN